jgi:hypothetical protein
LKQRKAARESLREMDVSFDEAKQLLKDYWQRPDDKGKKGSLTPAYWKRVKALKRLYGVE